MRKLREFLRLHFEQKLSGRAIARSLGISPSTAFTYQSRIRVSGLTWPLAAEMESEEALTRALFVEAGGAKKTAEPDWASIHAELKRKHVTKILLWQGCRESQQAHIAGEKCFVDFAGG